MFLPKLYWQITFVQGWGQFLFCNSIPTPIPIPIPFYYPSALRAGEVLSYWYGRAGGRPDWQTLRNAYLWNCLMDFHCSKLNGIVLTWSCAMSWSFVNLPHMGLPMGLKLVKTGTNGVQTLWNTYLWIWNHWTDLLHSKFYGIVWTCSCATSWSFTHLPHMVLPIGQKVVKSGTTGVPTLPNTYLWTTGWICSIWSSMILYKPGVVQYHGLMTFTSDFQGQIMKNHVEGIGRLVDTERKGCGSIESVTHFAAWHFGLSHDLDLEFSRWNLKKKLYFGNGRVD